MGNSDKTTDDYSLDQILETLGIKTMAEMEMTQLPEPEEKHDEVAIFRKKIRRLEKQNVILLERLNEVETHAALAMQQNLILREEIKAAFVEMGRREERSIEKNVLPFEGEQTKQKILFFVKPKDLKELKKEKKVSPLSYPMGIEHTKWLRN